MPKLIGYDLRKAGQDYSGLYDEIKSLGSTWWHYLDSTWLVATPLTTDQVVDKLRPHFDSGDRLLVIDVTADSYQGLLPEEAWKWIHEQWYKP